MANIFTVWSLGCCFSSGAPSSYMEKLGGFPVWLRVLVIVMKLSRTDGAGRELEMPGVPHWRVREFNINDSKSYDC
jgi:hypothetical protein